MIIKTIQAHKTSTTMRHVFFRSLTIKPITENKKITSLYYVLVQYKFFYFKFYS
jgi:hypothetical protein